MTKREWAGVWLLVMGALSGCAGIDESVCGHRGYALRNVDGVWVCAGFGPGWSYREVPPTAARELR